MSQYQQPQPYGGPPGGPSPGAPQYGQAGPPGYAGPPAYGAQQGWPAPGQWPGSPRQAGPGAAYLVAALFLVAAVIALSVTLISWDGTTRAGAALAAVIGIVFSDDLTGNVDFGISVSMSIACTTILFALLMFTRIAVFRWILVVLGVVVSAYYLYAVIYLLVNDAASVVWLAAVCLVLWAGATILAASPLTGRAIRRRAVPGY